MTEQERLKLKPIQIRVTDQELAQLKAMAKAERRSLNSFILWSLLYRDTKGGEK